MVAGFTIKFNQEEEINYGVKSNVLHEPFRPVCPTLWHSRPQSLSRLLAARGLGTSTKTCLRGRGREGIDVAMTHVREGSHQQQNMAASNIATEEDELTIPESNEKGSSDEKEDSVDLGIAVVPLVNFTRSKNEFETINLDGDDEEEEDHSDGDHSDEKRKKRKYKKKRKKHPIEELSESSSEEDGRRTRKDKSGEVNPVSFIVPSQQII